MGEGRWEGLSGGDIFLFREVRVDVIAIVVPVGMVVMDF
jgi:hypothetical protein